MLNTTMLLETQQSFSCFDVGGFFSMEILKLTASGECSVSVKAQGVFRLFAAFLISLLVCLMMMTGLLSAIKEDNLQKLSFFFFFSALFNDVFMIFACTQSCKGQSFYEVPRPPHPPNFRCT